MASKISKTLRLSDDIVRLIEEQPGDNFTAKFELLVMKCVQELPEAQAQLQRVRNQIADERKRLTQAVRLRQELERNTRTINQQLDRLHNQMDHTINELHKLTTL